MSDVRLQLDAAIGFLQRDARLFLSYRAGLITRVLTILFTLTLFYYVSRLVRVPQFRTPADYFAFVVVGLVILELLHSTLIASAQVRQELVAGTFERVVLSPFGAVAGIVASTLFPLVMSFGIAIAMLTLGAALFGLPLAWSTLPVAVPVALLGSLTVASIALIFAGLVIVFKQAANGVALVTALIALVSGAYFPVALLPGWLSWMSDVQPFKPTMDLLRHFIVGTPMPGSTAGALGKLVGFLIVFLPLSVLVLRASMRAAQRRGTILEY